MTHPQRALLNPLQEGARPLSFGELPSARLQRAQPNHRAQIGQLAARIIVYMDYEWECGSLLWTW